MLRSELAVARREMAEKDEEMAELRTQLNIESDNLVVAEASATNHKPRVLT